MTADNTTKELSVLTYIDQNSHATQRELSEHVGISLGSINILIKQLVRKGLIKIERLQPNSVQYFLTPQGLASKIERTYSYIIRTYKEVEHLRFRITNTLKPLVKDRKHIIFIGPNDDFSILLNEITEREFPHIQKIFSTPNEVKALHRKIQKDNNILLITWSPEIDGLLKRQSLPFINILSGIDVIRNHKDTRGNEE